MAGVALILTLLAGGTVGLYNRERMFPLVSVTLLLSLLGAALLASLLGRAPRTPSASWSRGSRSSGAPSCGRGSTQAGTTASLAFRALIDTSGESLIMEVAL